MRASGVGAIAQLGERLNGIQEVSGSIPLGSTTVQWETRGLPAMAHGSSLGFIVRLLLLVGLVYGTAPQVATRGDTALAWARLAGAICLADGPVEMPVEHPHDHCLACQGSVSTVGPVVTFALLQLVPVNQGLAICSVPVVGRVGWAAYASRAPPLSAG